MLMMDKTLDQAQQLVDRLTPHDQVRLLAYLATRVAQVLPNPSSDIDRSGPVDVWEKFFELGDGLSTTDSSDSNTLTEAVLSMRR